MVAFNADELTFPEEYKPGCLPRESRVGQICPMAKDRIPLIPKRDWSKLIPKITTRHFVGQIYNQRSVGSCASESSTKGMSISRVKYGMDYVHFNPYFVYRHVNHGRDAGSSIDANLAYLRQDGVCPEAVWPRSKGWRARPSQEAYRIAKRYRILEFYDVTNEVELVSCILYGIPVVFGYSGHAICAVAMADTRRLIYVNSWGSNWGDSGFGTLSLSRIYWPYGAFAVRTATFPLTN